MLKARAAFVGSRRLGDGATRELEEAAIQRHRDSVYAFKKGFWTAALRLKQRPSLHKATAARRHTRSPDQARTARQPQR